MQRKQEQPIPDYCTCRGGRPAIGGVNCIGCGKRLGKHTRRNRRRMKRQGKDPDEITPNQETNI